MAASFRAPGDRRPAIREHVAPAAITPAPATSLTKDQGERIIALLERIDATLICIAARSA